MSAEGPRSATPSTRYDGHDDVELVRLASRLARCGGWSLEVPSGETYWTEEMFTLLGYEPATGTPSYEIGIRLYPDGHREVVVSAIERCVGEGTPIDLESVVIARDGSEMKVRIIAQAVRDDSGAIIRVQGLFHDISEIVGERERRIAAQSQLAAVLEYLPDMLVFLDESWRVTYLNRAAQTLAGLPPDRIHSETVWTLFPELAGTAFRPAFEGAMRDRVSRSARDYVKQLGAWVDVTAHPVDGGIALFARDVTEDEERRHLIDEATHHAIAQASLLDASNEAMMMEDLNNVVTYWNHGAEQIYGWTAEEAVGRNIRELLYPDATVFEAPAAALLRDGTWRGEMVQRTKDGRTVIIECRWQAVLDAEGRPVKLFAVNSDVTAARVQQELRARAQRMESLGTLAGGIAHDLNNVLTPILMTVQLLQSKPDREIQDAMLDGVEVAVKRGAAMIQQVLSFARGVDGERDVLDLGEVVNELSAILLRTLPNSITMNMRIERVPPIVGDKTQVLQVLMNLIANARDSITGTGSVTLSVGQTTIAAAAGSPTDLAPGEYAVISVEDSGEGMTREVLDRIFEPFFTTKELGKGTGLGLASSLAIVQSHGGSISAYSESGVGSKFVVYLPLAADSVAFRMGITRAETSPPTGAGQVVLVVDDEPAIRHSVRSTLEANGYRVVEAGNGREAITVFANHSDEVALMLTDMMMPVMDGAAAASYFFSHHPHVAIVAMSGLNANDAIVRAGHTGVRHFVSKPFTIDTLLRTIHTALSERKQPL